MANKFSKSIMDRREQEALQQKKSAESPSTLDQNRTQPAYPVQESSDREVPELSEFLSSSVRRRAKGKTFYLDEQLLTAVESAANAQNISESRLVNGILRTVLGL